MAREAVFEAARCLRARGDLLELGRDRLLPGLLADGGGGALAGCL